MKQPEPLAAPNSGPLFRQVAGSLAAGIRDGRFPVGALLPTEHAVARQYGVSRHTVRQAFGMLRADGLIASRQGIGTVVVRDRAPSDYTESYSSIEELTTYAQGHPIRVDRLDDLIADETLAAEIGCAAGQAFLAISGRRYDRTGKLDAPVCHVVAYVDARFAAIRHRIADLRTAVVAAIEEEFGHAVARIAQEIKPATIPDAYAGLLRVEPGTPALSLTRWYFGADERVFEIAQSYYPIGRFTYRTELIRRR